MANVIAVIWDFDKTLVDGYMQDPIFEEYGVNAADFWQEVDGMPNFYQNEQGIPRVNRDTIYLNLFIRYAKNGKFKGLNNAKLREFGKRLKFYPGVPEIFHKTKELIEKDPKYSEYSIKVEHYVVSTGMAEIIRGSEVSKYVEDIWGCELLESEEENGEKVLSEIAYTIDNTTKTRALFEINKGTPKLDIDVNASIPDVMRRVRFENMIYVADGPSDIPAFSLINKNGGATFAIYPRGNFKALEQVEKLRENGRIHMYAEADYSEGTTAFMWISSKIQQFAKTIYEKERSKLKDSVSSVPKHLPE